jgi:hypothetical protein
MMPSSLSSASTSAAFIASRNANNSGSASASFAAASQGSEGATLDPRQRRSGLAGVPGAQHLDEAGDAF